MHIWDADVHSVACCDVCKINPQLASKELRILVDAITVAGSKGEASGSVVLCSGHQNMIGDSGGRSGKKLPGSVT